MSKFSISNLDLYYDNGAFKALKNINLEIPANEITAFIGPSGCGKSTLLKSLNRMNDLVEGCKITGKVLLDGEDIYGDMNINLLRKRVGMVFQKPNPFPMSIYDNIAYGPRTHGIRSKVKLDDIVELSLIHISGSGACKLVGPAGEVELTEGVIAAKRHVHMTPEDAEKAGVADKQIVELAIESPNGRSLTFGDVVVRVSASYATAAHIDTDEANALAPARECYGEMIVK